jgi:hypothetical protein
MRLSRLVRTAALAGAILLGPFLAAEVLAADAPAVAGMRLVSAFPDATARPQAAKGAIVWSHGRSLDVEDSEAPTPPWLVRLAGEGWDVFRFNRLSLSDSLPGSSRVLSGWVDELRRRGYRNVVLAGQSFGAFLSLLAASSNDGVDAVVATAPAAFGSFSDSYETWRLNATRLYGALGSVRKARVMLFFFHGDEFDPGGRAERAGEILAARGLPHIIVDQPADLPGHGAANTGLFVRRFADCISAFVDPVRLASMASCEQPWGRRPSAFVVKASVGGSTLGTVPVSGPSSFAGRWYGFYLNGREVVLSVERAESGSVRASYTLGPGVVAGQDAETSRRAGRFEGHELVFDEPGSNVLRYRMRPDGRLAGSWTSMDGTSRLDILMQRIN